MGFFRGSQPSSRYHHLARRHLTLPSSLGIFSRCHVRAEVKPALVAIVANDMVQAKGTVKVQTVQCKLKLWIKDCSFCTNIGFFVFQGKRGEKLPTLHQSTYPPNPPAGTLEGNPPRVSPRDEESRLIIFYLEGRHRHVISGWTTWVYIVQNVYTYRRRYHRCIDVYIYIIDVYIIDVYIHGCIYYRYRVYSRHIKRVQ